MNKELRRYESVIKPLMGSKRFKHSVNVAEMCLTLAKKFGADEDKAYTAGILHDCQKEADKAVMLSEAENSGYYIDPAERDSAKLWHGIAGAYYVKNTLKITDKDILNAIRFHTVGRADMTVVEKIVFLADMVSAERDYPHVEKYRAAVLDDLDNGMFQTLRWSILKTVGAGYNIPVTTLEAYTFYSRFKKGELLP
ncbi:MAG: bis(5'-nucleosyl)-tetraphosphatase (symmetrical) YqeK [Bacteroides sp.]|nr:bis(5'-nucleosyl)-tetraphosphatase (symmetrical) YqeK [Bacteroides sp.]